jgi:hypothetical protein
MNGTHLLQLTARRKESKKNLFYVKCTHRKEEINTLRNKENAGNCMVQTS